MSEEKKELSPFKKIMTTLWGFLPVSNKTMVCIVAELNGTIDQLIQRKVEKDDIVVNKITGLVSMKDTKANK